MIAPSRQNGRRFLAAAGHLLADGKIMTQKEQYMGQIKRPTPPTTHRYDLLRTRMEQKGYTIEDVARLSGSTESLVGKVMNGEETGTLAIIRVMDVVGVSAEEFCQPVPIGTPGSNRTYRDDILRAARSASGKRIKDIAAETGHSRSTVSEVMRGKMPNVGVRTLSDIARSVGIEMGALFI